MTKFAFFRLTTGLSIAAVIAAPAVAEKQTPDQPSRSKQIAKFDINADGKLDAAELTKMMEDRAAKKANGGAFEPVDPQRVKRFIKRADKNGDNMIGPSEWPAPRTKKRAPDSE